MLQKRRTSIVAEADYVNITKSRFFNVPKVEFEKTICRKFSVFQHSACDKMERIERKV